MANRIEMEGVTVDFGEGHFDWHCFPAGVSSGPPSDLAAGFPVIGLANACRATGDPKYAESCARLLMDWLENVPNPRAYGLALPSVESSAWWVVGHGARRYPLAGTSHECPRIGCLNSRSILRRPMVRARPCYAVIAHK
ncbi:MAG: hypothetical protein NTW86_29105 [Candidatus Sumerlaeota bacterium]|nr:hypothetical protein [Candidatus Sumerlaeota bacterium]